MTDKMTCNYFIGETNHFNISKIMTIAIINLSLDVTDDYNLIFESVPTANKPFDVFDFVVGARTDYNPDKNIFGIYNISEYYKFQKPIGLISAAWYGLGPNVINTYNNNLNRDDIDYLMCWTSSYLEKFDHYTYPKDHFLIEFVHSLNPVGIENNQKYLKCIRTAISAVQQFLENYILARINEYKLNNKLSFKI